MRALLIDYIVIFALLTCFYVLLFDPAFGEQFIRWMHYTTRSAWWALHDFFN